MTSIASLAAKLISVTNVVTSKDKKYKMPLELWLPFKLNTQNYWFIFILEVFGLIYGANWAALFDLLFTVLILYLCYEFD